jgi:hypothetical protein
METPKIKITLKPGEPIKVEALNVKGSGCTAMTPPLMNLGEAGSTELKSDYYEEPDIQISSRVDIGC